ncbi:unnamed protein product [Sphenostylis stenocarpa]|uniref:Uncharacterized protein n=1 Tax=Sphenostylis stenocarpa TaxID=92480 RepID=A0AA86W2B5_9FABA|nr:unnamed protein product [Sphenostylis stenocarpa]
MGENWKTVLQKSDDDIYQFLPLQVLMLKNPHALTIVLNIDAKTPAGVSSFACTLVLDQGCQRLFQWKHQQQHQNHQERFKILGERNKRDKSRASLRAQRS